MCKPNANTAFNKPALTCRMITVMEEELLRQISAQMTRLYQAAKDLHGVEGKSAVAKLMNVSPQTLNNWEERSISNEGLLLAQEKIGCDAIWLRDGTGEITRGRKIDPELDELAQLISLYAQSTAIGKRHILDFAKVAEKEKLPKRSLGNKG